MSELLASNQINYPPPKHLEQTVYSGFPSDADDLWMERFHTLPWEERSKVLDGFEDSRYKELAERLVCVNQPDSVMPDTLERYRNFVNQRLYDKGLYHKAFGLQNSYIFPRYRALQSQADSHKRVSQLILCNVNPQNHLKL